MCDKIWDTALTSEPTRKVGNTRGANDLIVESGNKEDITVTVIKYDKFNCIMELIIYISGRDD